jgi:hypothetical protein
MRDVGQQSLFDCQRTLVITFDHAVETSTFNLELKTIPIERSSFDQF